MAHNHGGVGLRFEGLPTDVVKFNWILAEQGCHPKAAERILNRIGNNGYDLLTVMSLLNFKWIKEELAKVGVLMEMIEPLEDWYDKYEDGPWPEEALPERFRTKLKHG